MTTFEKFGAGIALLSTILLVYSVLESGKSFYESAAIMLAYVAVMFYVLTDNTSGL